MPGRGCGPSGRRSGDARAFTAQAAVAGGALRHELQARPCITLLVRTRLVDVKRTAVIKRLRKAAKDQGMEFEVMELTRHTAVRVGPLTRTLGRHSEVDEVTAGTFFDQFADTLGGKGWWR